jgi:hypothetical protein
MPLLNVTNPEDVVTEITRLASASDLPPESSPSREGLIWLSVRLAGARNSQGEKPGDRGT